MRTHLELDGGVEMRSFEAIEALRRDYAWAIDVEVCVFPQEGLTNNPRSDELLVEGLKRGARVIGAAPNYDPDHAGQIHRVFDLAREFDVDIDMHLDSGNSPERDGHPSGVRADREVPAWADASRSGICASCPPCRSPTCARWRGGSPMQAWR